jgi:AraC family transcriptional regulator
MWLHERRLRAGQSHQMHAVPSPRLPQTEIVVIGGEGSVLAHADLQCLVLVLAGSCTLAGNDGRIEIGARQWLVAEADARVQVLGGERALALVIGFSEAAVRALTPRAKRALLPGQGGLDRETLRFLAAALRDAGAPSTQFWMREAAMRSLLRRVLMLQEDLLRLLTACPGKSASQKSQVLTRLQRARMYLEANSDRNVRIADLARLTNFSHWYFTKTFHRVYGLSPKSYATHLRLRRARRLLTHDAVSVGEAALACGFDTASAFARAYRQHFGASPSGQRQTAVS